MPPDDHAVAALFRGPLDQFIAERKRLAAERKAAGDPAGATRIGKLARPPLSAWAVNQLHWHARASLDALFEAAARVRKGEGDAAAAHRDELAKLRERASAILTDAGHAATEATLRRVTQTLSALAATGSWDPDSPGALTADRDPPGFEAMSGVDVSPRHREAPPSAAMQREEEERRRLEEARAKKAVERRRLEGELLRARADLDARERDVVKVEKDLASARRSHEEAKAAVAALEAELARNEG